MFLLAKIDIAIKNIFLTLFVFIMGLTVAGQDAITKSNLNLRSAPNTESQVILKIPKGTAVRIDNCGLLWCETSYQGHTGYVFKSYTTSRQDSPKIRSSRNDAQPTGAIKHYTNSKGERVQSPTYYNKVPEGATAECRDGTYSFSRSRRGTCSHHGGVKRWLQ